MGRRARLAARGVALAAVAGLLALLVWDVAHHGSNRVDSSLRSGRRPLAPNFELPRIDTPGRLELASLRGKVVVVNFWNAYCVPCRAEAPELQRAYRRFRAQGVQFVGVDFEDFSGDARRFARRYGMTYPLVHDAKSTLVKPYGLTGYPETFFVDRRGRVTKHYPGQISGAELTAQIRRALRS